jgi:hypothetical protein
MWGQPPSAVQSSEARRFPLSAGKTSRHRHEIVRSITEFEWNHHFADVQEKGPFKTWRHRHEFTHETRDGTDGTLVADLIDYDPGFGPAGSLVNQLIIRPKMQSAFAARQKILPDLLSWPFLSVLRVLCGERFFRGSPKAESRKPEAEKGVHFRASRPVTKA